jgi:hypothetical protein
MASVDWESVSKGAAVIAALAGAAAPLLGAAARPRARANLKSDLEILERLHHDDPAHAMLKAYIDAQLTRMYGDVGAWRRAMIFAGTSTVLGGAALLIYGFANGIAWWWYVIGGYLLFAGSIALPQALRGPASAHAPESPSRDAASPPVRSARRSVGRSKRAIRAE